MRQVSFTLTFMISTLACVGQTATTTADTTNLSNSFVALTNTLIKQEIAMFNFKGTTLTRNMSVKPTLTEIPLRSCDGKTVDFYKGGTFIHLHFKQKKEKGEITTTNQLDSISLVTHSNFLVEIPRSALAGLSNIFSCSITKSKTKQDLYSPFFKSFQSADKRRIYIYLIGGLDHQRYEVTWVIKDNTFFTRTIDPI